MLMQCGNRIVKACCWLHYIKSKYQNMMKKGEMDKMLTINEYKNHHGISNIELSEMLNVSRYTVGRWCDGEGASPAYVKKLNAIGITHPVSRHQQKKPEKKVEVKVVEPEFDSKILKPYHVSIMKGYGRTIIAKKHTAEDIINEFARFGLSVVLSDFQDKTHYDWNTHYVVTLVGDRGC